MRRHVDRGPHELGLTDEVDGLARAIRRGGLSHVPAGPVEVTEEREDGSVKTYPILQGAYADELAEWAAVQAAAEGPAEPAPVRSWIEDALEDYVGDDDGVEGVLRRAGGLGRGRLLSTLGGFAQRSFQRMAISDIGDKTDK